MKLRQNTNNFLKIYSPKQPHKKRPFQNSLLGKEMVFSLLFMKICSDTGYNHQFS